jgi:hypothetical protein
MNLVRARKLKNRSVGREESAVRRGECEWGTEVRVISALAQTSLSSRASLPSCISFLTLYHPFATPCGPSQFLQMH